MPATLASFGQQVFQATLWLLVLAAVFIPMERLFPQVRQAVFRRQFTADLGYYYLANLFSLLLIGIMSGALGVMIYRALPSVVIEFGQGLTVWQRMLATLVVGEFGFYWGHRWSHEWPLLYQFHVIHHSAEDVDWLTNTRAHPVDLLLTRFCGLTLIYGLGLAQIDAVATPTGTMVAVFTMLWGYFVHANVRWRFGWLEYVIATPAFHRWHHVNDGRRDMNYASTLPLWDWVFGSLYLPKRDAPPAFGADQKLAPTMVGQLLLLRGE